MAGVTPKITPTSMENPNESAIDHQVMVVVKTNWSTKSAMPTPKIMPMIPPTPDNVKASIKNWLRISLLRAPKAFLKPISRVLSVTETSIIFITPIPPTIKDIAAMPPKARVKTPVIWEIVDNACSCVWTVKSSAETRFSKRVLVSAWTELISSVL